MTNLLLLALGALAGVAAQLNLLAARPDEAIAGSDLVTRVVAGVVVGPLLVVALRKLTRWGARRAGLPAERLARFEALDAWSYLALLAPVLGAFGVRMGGLVLGPAILLFLLGKPLAALGALPSAARKQWLSSREALAALFFLSGFAALIYQIVWQRRLFSIYGVNVESITVVVAIFMAGLGLGALAGGRLARLGTARLPKLFLWCELLVGAFGVASIPLIDAVGAATLALPLPAVTAVVFALLLVPTLLMGATLPVLVAYLYARWEHVGRSVGLLYFVNTLGSAVACFVTVHVLFLLVGQHAATLVAAAFNVTTGVLSYWYMRRLEGAR